MLNIDFNIEDVQDIINYFSEDNTNSSYYESERRSSLGKLALTLDTVCQNINSENIEDMKRLIEKVAEANRVIATSEIKSKANKD